MAMHVDCGLSWRYFLHISIGPIGNVPFVNAPAVGFSMIGHVLKALVIRLRVQQMFMRLVVALFIAEIEAYAPYARL